MSWIGSELIAQFNFQEYCSLDNQVKEIERWPAARLNSLRGAVAQLVER